MIITASTDPGTGEVVVYASGQPILRLTRRKANLLIMRLAEALA